MSTGNVQHTKRNRRSSLHTTGDNSMCTGIVRDTRRSQHSPLHRTAVNTVFTYTLKDAATNTIGADHPHALLLDMMQRAGESFKFRLTTGTLERYKTLMKELHKEDDGVCVVIGTPAVALLALSSARKLSPQEEEELTELFGTPTADKDACDADSPSIFGVVLNEAEDEHLSLPTSFLIAITHKRIHH